ncbi:MAG: asparagine synthase (glutamine-hydrolyzing) [Alphaproteobacteria bacterium]
MCGIVGFWRPTTAIAGDSRRLARMAATLTHRGPDDYGYLYANSLTGRTEVTQAEETDVAPNVLLANRRLIITDPSEAGRQPIANDTGDVFVVFNGAIHNYVELREELKALGYRFRSRTDTEVLLHAYEEWGEACATRFNGMWAYAIWDHRHRKLVCSRDRFGIKPLFIARTANTFYFASEAKAILASGEIPREPNLGYFRHMLTADVPFEGRQTPFAGIEQLPAGHNLVVTPTEAHESRYWDYGTQSESYDYAAPRETFRELMSDAVKIRLRGDVPVGLLLSGGLDSSVIAVLAARHSPGRIEAYTAHIPGFHRNESDYAAVAAQHAGIPLTPVDCSPRNLLEDVAAVTWYMDAPVAMGQMLARWPLIRAASAGGARIILEGQGADELLGGYEILYAGAYLRSELAQFRRGASCTPSLRLLALAAAHKANVYLEWRVASHRARRAGVPKRLLSRRLDSAPPYGGTAPDGEAPAFGDPLTRRLWQDHARLALPYLLHFGDAIYMGHSTELRLPFLDHRLVEFAFALPFREKIRGREFKVILRESLKHDLAAGTLARKKKVGFPHPLAEWLKPAWRSEILPLFNSSRFRQRDLFDANALSQLLTTFETRGLGAQLVLQCAATELWFRQFIDGDGFPARSHD